MSNGNELSHENWQNYELCSFALVMAQEKTAKANENDRTVLENTLMILLNASTETIEFPIPKNNISTAWEVIIDTSSNTLNKEFVSLSPGAKYTMIDKSLVLLKPAKPDSQRY